MFSSGCAWNFWTDPVNNQAKVRMRNTSCTEVPCEVTDSTGFLLARLRRILTERKHLLLKALTSAQKNIDAALQQTNLLVEQLSVPRQVGI